MVEVSNQKSSAINQLSHLSGRPDGHFFCQAVCLYFRLSGFQGVYLSVCLSVWALAVCVNKILD